MKLTQQELIDKARDRFGPDAKLWKFRCMNCGDEACAQDFIDAGASVYPVGQECIGRLVGALDKPPTNTRGCDFAAYGLIPGPWEVVFPAEGDQPERTVRSFALAGGESQ